MKIPSFLLLTGLALGSLASTAQAQFTGNYALTPPSGQDFTGNTTAGFWNFSISPIAGGGGSGSLDTTLQPNSFTMQAVASGTSNSTISSLAYVSVPEAGTITFDYNFTDNFQGTGGTANFTYDQNEVPIVISSNSTGSGSWEVQPGDSLSFNTFASGGEVGGFFPQQTQSVVTISNFSFTNATVPEPAEFALGAGLLAIGVAQWRRRKSPGASLSRRTTAQS